MFHKFDEYEIVQMRGGETRTVRGWEIEEDRVVFVVRLPNKKLLQVPENKLETTGHFETPFRVYEVVEIHPVDITTESEVVNLIGKRGVGTAIGSNDHSEHWGYNVAVQGGVRWYFGDHELRATGIFLSHDELYGPGEGTFLARVSFDPVTEEETVIAGDASLLNRGPTPLPIDLESLSA